jgi:hypothetical protein
MSVQLFTKFLFSALFALAMANTATAQNVFWEYDFSNQAAVFVDWVSGGTNDGPGDWEWSNDPGAINFGAQPDFGATTASNGYVWFNSDGNGNFSHDITLTHGPIDCSASNQVYLTAENQYAFFSAATISIAEVGVSTDGGATFTYYQIHTDVPQNDLSAAVNPVNLELPEAANQAEVYIQFRWRGFYEYTWKIDDVKLLDGDPRPAHDVQVNNFHAIAPNYQVPASQVTNFGFIADVANIGSAEQMNVDLTITITEEGGSQVFSDMLTYGSIAADSVAENVFFENEFTPAAVPGTVYEGQYTLEIENMDSFPANNIRTFPFEVTDTIYAKDAGTGLYATRPADDNNFRFGNVFYVQNAQNEEGEDLYARYLSFLIGNPDDLAGESVTLFVYEWEGDSNEDFQANVDEYGGAPIAFNSYTFSGNEEGLITVPTGFDGEFLPLQDDTYYIAVVEFADTGVDNFMGASGDLDYQAMNFYQDSVGNKDKWVLALDVGNTGDFSLVGFGFDAVPVVRLSVGPLTDVATQDLLPQHALSVYPTVANNEIWAEVELEEATRELNLTIFNANGQAVQNLNYDNVKQDIFRINVQSLATGNYYMRIATDEGIRSMPFIIQR